MGSPRRSANYEARKRLEKIFSQEPYDYFTVIKVLENLRKIQSSRSERKRVIFGSEYYYHNSRSVCNYV